MEDEDWARQRRAAAEVHADRLERKKRAEQERADRLLREFAAAARGRLPVERLRVQGYGGRGSATSDVDGWYLRTDRAAGVGTEGDFYILTAPLGLRERLRGVRLAPSPPPMVLGAGGRDGDSIDLPDALDRLLPGWRDDDSGDRSVQGA